MIRTVLGALLLAALSFGQQQRPLKPARYNYQNFKTIAHIAAGGQWTTTIVLTTRAGGGGYNYGLDLWGEDHDRFQVTSSNGSPLQGSSNGTTQFEITSTDGRLAEGGGSIICQEPGCPNVAVILRNTIQSTGYVSEATELPLVSIYGDTTPFGQVPDQPTSMPFDNTGNFHSSIALADGELQNPEDTLYPNLSVTIDVYNEAGTHIGSHVEPLEPLQHKAFRLEDKYTETAGIKGLITFTVPPTVFLSAPYYPPPVAVTGQRFLIEGSSQAFTILPLNFSTTSTDISRLQR